MNNKGFTLVELLIAMAIASVVGMAGISMFSSSNWAYKVNVDVAEAQQNERVAADWLSKDVRMAGFALPAPPFTIGFDTDDDGVADMDVTAPVTFTNGGAAAPDTITLLGGYYEAGTLSGNPPVQNFSGSNTICYRPSGDGDRFFRSDDSIFSSRRNISLNGTTSITLAFGQTKGAVCNGTGTISLSLGTPTTLDRDYVNGTPVFIIQAITYSIDTVSAGCSATNPCLSSSDSTQLRGGTVALPNVVVAEGIEDIQFAYGIDLNPRDGRIDYASPYDAADYLNSPADPSSILAVRANIVAKARNIDPKGGGFTRPALEDRTASAADAYRRRVLTKIIKLRNPRQGA